MISWSSSSRTTRQIGKHYKVMFVGPIIIDHACHHGQLQQYFKSDFAHKHLSRDGLVSLQTIAMLQLTYFSFLFVLKKWQKNIISGNYSNISNHILPINICQEMDWYHYKPLQCSYKHFLSFFLLQKIVIFSLCYIFKYTPTFQFKRD